VLLAALLLSVKEMWSFVMEKECKSSAANSVMEKEGIKGWPVVGEGIWRVTWR
jgi:hypothetical protein